MPRLLRRHLAIAQFEDNTVHNPCETKYASRPGLSDLSVSGRHFHCAFVRVTSGRRRSKKSIFFQILRRATILFLLGILVNGFPYFHWHMLRIYGVLQRIAICFLLVSALYLWGHRISSKIAIVTIALLGYWICCDGFRFQGSECRGEISCCSIQGQISRRISIDIFFRGVFITASEILKGC